LKDQTKRDLYDKYGIDGVREGGGVSGFEDIFSHIFGGGRGHGGGKPKGPTKGKAVLKEVTIKLEDAYCGKLLVLPITRTRICEPCEGKGGSDVKNCTKCKGKGIVEKMV